jgi:hypothetical protein
MFTDLDCTDSKGRDRLVPASGADAASPFIVRHGRFEFRMFRPSPAASLMTEIRARAVAPAELSCCPDGHTLQFPLADRATEYRPRSVQLISAFDIGPNVRISHRTGDLGRRE